jgi:hypothetical protein
MLKSKKSSSKLAGLLALLLVVGLASGCASKKNCSKKGKDKVNMGWM